MVVLGGMSAVSGASDLLALWAMTPRMFGGMGGLYFFFLFSTWGEICHWKLVS